MIRLLLAPLLVSLVLHGFPSPGHAAAIVKHRSSAGNGSFNYGSVYSPYSSSSGGSSSSAGSSRPPSYEYNPNPYPSYPGGPSFSGTGSSRPPNYGYSSNPYPSCSGAGQPYSGGNGPPGYGYSSNPYSSYPGGT
ncbi:hypothetical protein CERZMDRAFT_86519 [Cercospora zeae-maydis SCOH1-5]|uniref:Uncharacterized protein n=1 Tax=Cercospora zeae-maydis SCOH1-5 TaxID=717836 RepID=A0A6A6F8Y9_9PEZI|nr:hypothetical protein CERZMDRAFT_86519 [Cercospora zeae-maydis SCOH1-5]